MFVLSTGYGVLGNVGANRGFYHSCHSCWHTSYRQWGSSLRQRRILVNWGLEFERFSSLGRKRPGDLSHHTSSNLVFGRLHKPVIYSCGHLDKYRDEGLVIQHDFKTRSSVYVVRSSTEKSKRLTASAPSLHIATAVLVLHLLIYSGLIIVSSSLLMVDYCHALFWCG